MRADAIRRFLRKPSKRGEKRKKGATRAAAEVGKGGAGQGESRQNFRIATLAISGRKSPRYCCHGRNEHPVKKNESILILPPSSGFGRPSSVSRLSPRDPPEATSSSRDAQSCRVNGMTDASSFLCLSVSRLACSLSVGITWRRLHFSARYECGFLSLNRSHMYTTVTVSRSSTYNRYGEGWHCKRGLALGAGLHVNGVE